MQAMKLSIIQKYWNLIFCDYSDVYILAWGDVTIVGDNEAQVTFKNYVPFTKCITKIDETTVDYAE